MTKEMPPQISNVHNATIANIEFFKKQQWAITNYTILIYAALFGLHKSLNNISACERCTLVSLTAFTFICSTAMLIRMQFATGKERKRLGCIHEDWLSEAQRNRMGIEPYTYPVWRGWEFLASLIVVIAFGALLVGYSLLRSQ